VIAAGHAFVQNLRRGHYELRPAPFVPLWRRTARRRDRTVNTVQQSAGDGRRVDIEVFGDAAG
jgi:hypothetical protein